MHCLTGKLLRTSHLNPNSGLKFEDYKYVPGVYLSCLQETNLGTIETNQGIQNRGVLFSRAVITAWNWVAKSKRNLSSHSPEGKKSKTRTSWPWFLQEALRTNHSVALSWLLLGVGNTWLSLYVDISPWSLPLSSYHLLCETLRLKSPSDIFIYYCFKTGFSLCFPGSAQTLKLKESQGVRTTDVYHHTQLLLCLPFENEASIIGFRELLKSRMISSPEP